MSDYDYYSVDASIMIRLKDMGPYDIFKPAWDEISRLVSTGQWNIFENVADDIHGETAAKWLADNSSAIVKLNPEINEYINELMADLQKNNMMIIDPSSLKNNTDPFVIMLALYLEKRDLKNLREKVSNETCCVLTNEEPRTNKINIPYVCEYYDIPYMNFPKFMRHHGWRISIDVQNP
jgi:hypothetical protein